MSRFLLHLGFSDGDELQASGEVLAVLSRATGIQYPSRPGSSVPVRADEVITIAFASNLTGILFTLPILLVVCLSGVPVDMEDGLSHHSKAYHRGGNRVRVERLPIDYTLFCCAMRIPCHPLGRYLVWACRGHYEPRR